MAIVSNISHQESTTVHERAEKLQQRSHVQEEAVISLGTFLTGFQVLVETPNSVASLADAACVTASDSDSPITSLSSISTASMAPHRLYCILGLCWYHSQNEQALEDEIRPLTERWQNAFIRSVILKKQHDRLNQRTTAAEETVENSMGIIHTDVASTTHTARTIGASTSALIALLDLAVSVFPPFVPMLSLNFVLGTADEESEEYQEDESDENDKEGQGQGKEGEREWTRPHSHTVALAHSYAVALQYRRSNMTGIQYAFHRDLRGQTLEHYHHADSAHDCEYIVRPVFPPPVRLGVNPLDWREDADAAGPADAEPASSAGVLVLALTLRVERVARPDAGSASAGPAASASSRQSSGFTPSLTGGGNTGRTIYSQSWAESA
jgi:hypothetical protein